VDQPGPERGLSLARFDLSTWKWKQAMPSVEHECTKEKEEEKPLPEKSSDASCLGFPCYTFVFS